MSGTALALMGTLGAQAAETGLNLFNRNWMAGREDSAVQRRVADMKKAGINPMLAAGNPATSQAPGQHTIDTNMANDLMVGQELNKLKLENKGLEHANNISVQQLEALRQEYTERLRNIDFYKRHNLPSDKPDGFLNSLSQGIEAVKGILDNPMLGATVDKAKAFTGNAVNKIKSEAPKAFEEAKAKAQNFARIQRQKNSSAAKSQAEYYKNYRGTK